MFECWSQLGDLGAANRCAEFTPLIYETADSYGIPRALALAQIRQESGCNPDVCSGAGACGLAQFTLGTALRFGLFNRKDPVSSMNAWGEYMTWLLDRYGWDYAAALAAYNWGEGHVDKAIDAYGADWLSHAPAETRQYVPAILGAAGSLEQGSAGAALPPSGTSAAGMPPGPGPSISTAFLPTGAGGFEFTATTAVLGALALLAVAVLS